MIASLYIYTKKLCSVLSLPLTLHYSLAPKLKRIKQQDPEHHKYDNAPVEVSLVAAVIVVLKLVYGLDGKKRYSGTLSFTIKASCLNYCISGFLETVTILHARCRISPSIWPLSSLWTMSALLSNTYSARTLLCTCSHHHPFCRSS